MKRLSSCRAVALGAAVLAGTAGLYSPSASAAPAPVRLTMVGSNTTQVVMGALAKTFNASAVATGENALVTNVYALPPAGGTVAPSDANCNGGKAITYVTSASPGPGELTAPNGSSAGKKALAASVTAGNSCVSIARSSSAGSSTDPAGTQAYAFAVDAVTWATAQTSDAPKNLSIKQLEGIYSCKYTNWKQVGGTSGAIARYFPQNGSGTGSFMAGMLGFDPRVLGGENTCSTPAIQIEENEANSVAFRVRHRAIMIFSAGAWIAQANHAIPNLRNGFVLHTIDKKAAFAVKLASGKWTTSSIVAEKNVEPSTYLPDNNRAVQGIRNLFNFINTNSVDYKAAASFVGAGSALCAGKDAATIRKYGFVPLAFCRVQF